MAQALTATDLQGALPLVARGKVRDLYEIDDKTLLFVATDRISAYDVIMENVHYSPHHNCLMRLLANASPSAT
jgi:phosphoribosylaminoimidazole-succinocarboxamide synthase